MQADIQAIIEDGVLAPSGENCQPWKFKVSKNSVSVFNVPQADQSLYNFNQKGSFVAHGALIENIVISAGSRGYEATVVLFPEKSEPDLVAVISLQKCPAKNEPLYSSIKERHTNRKPHSPQKLSAEQKKELADAAQKINAGEFKILDDAATLAKLGKALSLNERIIFENRELHDFFYGHILWNEKDQEHSGGFYFETLEFLPPQLKAVKLLKNWSVLSILNKIGISKKIAEENAEKYARSGAVGAVLMQSGNAADFVNAGRIAERVWLTAMQNGLSVHPCTGTLYFMERIKGGDTISFSPKHQKLIVEAYADISEAFQADGKVIPMLFLIGFAEKATARAKRMAPHIIFE